MKIDVTPTLDGHVCVEYSSDCADGALYMDYRDANILKCKIEDAIEDIRCECKHKYHIYERKDDTEKYVTYGVCMYCGKPMKYVSYFQDEEVCFDD